MAIITNDYMIIGRKKIANKELRDIVLEYLQKSGFEVKEDVIIVDAEDAISYQFDGTSVSDRIYLCFEAKMNQNKALKSLECIDRCLSGDINKYMHIIRIFDGISATYCDKLYPKFALFERRFRQLILTVLTKAFGTDWVNKVFTIEKQNEYKGKSHSEGNFDPNKILELMTMHDLEEFLFSESIVDIKSLCQSLSEGKSDELIPIEDLIKTISENERSLWNTNFSEIGSEQIWKERIEKLRRYRNIIAHNKTIRKANYDDCIKLLRSMNKEIQVALEKIKVKELSGNNRFDIWAKFESWINRVSSCSELLAEIDFSEFKNSLEIAFHSLAQIAASDVYRNYLDAVDRSNETIRETMKKIPKIDLEQFNLANRNAIFNDVSHMSE